MSIKVEFIESYIKPDGSGDYIWNDNHGELIRCKDCEYYTREDRWCRRLGLCGAFDPDGFCCWGERKEDEL